MRKVMLLASAVCLFATVARAQDEGFFTRTMVGNPQVQSAGYIECWRSSEEAPSPVRIYTAYYDPQGQQNPYYIQWWIGGSPQLDYDWDYTYPGWRLNGNDTMFSDYPGWQLYSEDSTGPWYYSLNLQLNTTRPSPPSRP